MALVFVMASASALTPASLSAAGAQPAGHADELAGLVNAYRSAGRQCGGEPMPMAGALAPSAVLAGVPPAAGGSLAKALSVAGYKAATATSLGVGGMPSADHSMAVLKDRFCRSLLDRRYSEIGVSRSGDSWRVVLAQPLLPADLPEWREAGKKILVLVNAARAEARTCGDRRFAPAAALSWNDALAAASLAHSRDMAAHDYFEHKAGNGDTVAERAMRQGYRWQSIGENIAAGQGEPSQVVAGWLASPHHCSNVMDAAYAEMGAAYATNPNSDLTIYWTQVLGKRR